LLIFLSFFGLLKKSKKKGLISRGALALSSALSPEGTGDCSLRFKAKFSEKFQFSGKSFKKGLDLEKLNHHFDGLSSLRRRSLKVYFM